MFTASTQEWGICRAVKRLQTRALSHRHNKLLSAWSDDFIGCRFFSAWLSLFEAAGESRGAAVKEKKKEGKESGRLELKLLFNIMF